MRGTTELLRRGAFGAMARALQPSETLPANLPLAEAETAFHLGRVVEARARLAAADGPAAHLHAAALLAAMGFPEEAPAHLAAATGLRAPVELFARSLEAGLHLAAGRSAPATEAARAQLALALATGAPFAVADVAITLAATADDWRVPLRSAAKWLRARGEGAALNLLKARWAEMRAAK